MIKLLVVLFALFLVSCGVSDNAVEESIDNAIDSVAVDSIEEGTTLIVKNISELDSVLVYLTFGADENFVTNVHGIFGIQDSGLVGSFYAVKDTKYVYDYNGKKGVSGNVCFGQAPMNCQTNLFEFTINNQGVGINPMETVDISCVSGVNCTGCISFGGVGWTDGEHIVSHIHNKEMYKNAGMIGVFPYLCDNCTTSTAPPICDNSKAAEPQSSPICNIQRSANGSSGSILIEFTSFVK